METVSTDIKRLLEDCELFVEDILKDEALSKQTQQTRETLLRNFRWVRSRNPQYFSRGESIQEDSSDDNQSSSLAPSLHSDDVSVASDYQEDGSTEYFEEDVRPVAAQELSNVLKQGYLEKKRRDHSFFGSEWQKRWCVLNNTIFYYFGSEKDKQQKGSFHINGYSAELVGNLRKDGRKNACFEMTAPGRRTFQFTASTPREAREWVDQINFVLKDLSSSFIPFDDDEEEEEEEELQDAGAGEGGEETYDDIETVPARPQPHANCTGEEEEEEDDIYEVLPEEDFTAQTDEGADKTLRAVGSMDYANYYQGLWDCEGEEPDELTFRRGDLIHIVSKEYNIHGWWVGELSGCIGIVPKDFLQPAYIL
ncbi:src kinase-associated phosphoprotein 1 [Amia ocellicauda]|uniref:src kinase-associated phosphoprotein 1 n=1 Tax=Amia ocellicauda TaxID=2972642 RepID=UPI003463B002|nr:SKAP1 protein [Amia calva]